MKLRTTTFVVCAIDAVAWAVVAIATFASGSDPATKGLDQVAGWAISALFAITTVPSLLLLLRRRAPVTAFVVALAFPEIGVAAFVAAVVAFD